MPSIRRHTWEGAQDLSLSAERSVHHAAELGLGKRHLLYPDGQGVHVSDCYYGLVLTASAGVARLEYIGDRGLPCRFGRSSDTLWGTGDFQYGPERSIYQRDAHDGVEDTRHYHQYGWEGRWVDNVFVERLWRDVKYEDVYLRAHETPAALRIGLTHYFRFYIRERRHKALNRRTPDAVYGGAPEVEKAA